MWWHPASSSPREQNITRQFPSFEVMLECRTVRIRVISGRLLNLYWTYFHSSLSSLKIRFVCISTINWKLYFLLEFFKRKLSMSGSHFTRRKLVVWFLPFPRRWGMKKNTEHKTDLGDDMEIDESGDVLMRTSVSRVKLSPIFYLSQ